MSSRNLVLRNFQSPGDIVMLTAAVRDLYVAHSDRFSIDVRSSTPALWENNPYLTRIDEVRDDAEVLDCDYPLIHASNQLPYHFLHGFRKDLESKLGLRIPAGPFKGDIHLSEEETQWMSQVEETCGLGARFWIINAGGKLDYTAKWWPRERFQQVVDAFRDRVMFVQVGAKQHYHPQLEGVLDLRGKTDMRQLVRLVYHADGILCGVTLLMHLAAAVPLKPGSRGLRPCVVVAGGREPAHWEAYPGHRYLDTIGRLPCCSTGGCWRSRTLPLGDGDEKDGSLCCAVVDGVQACMRMIDPGIVVRGIEDYYEGGALDPCQPEAVRDWRRRHREAVERKTFEPVGRALEG